MQKCLWHANGRGNSIQIYSEMRLSRNMYPLCMDVPKWKQWASTATATAAVKPVTRERKYVSLLFLNSVFNLPYWWRLNNASTHFVIVVVAFFHFYSLNRMQIVYHSLNVAFVLAETSSFLFKQIFRTLFQTYFCHYRSLAFPLFSSLFRFLSSSTSSSHFFLSGSLFSLLACILSFKKMLKYHLIW